MLLNMDYLLYGCRRSGSLTVELALAEIGAKYAVEDVDLDQDAQRDENYAAINRQRKLPTLVTPDGETLTESAAILLTLDERHPEAGLLPPVGSTERARAIRWLLFIATEIYPVVEINDYPERFAPSAESAPSVREIARETWRRRWLLVEEAIEGSPWFLEQGFSLTDIYIAVVSRWAQQDDWRPDNISRVEALTAAVAARPSARAIWQRHNPDRMPDRFD